MKFYQDEKKLAYTVGLFTLFALLILFFGYSWLSEYFESRKYTEIRVSFPNAANIEIGSPVTILGVQKGRVGSIEVKETKVDLILEVKLDFPLKQGTRFLIRETNLMGDVQIEIIPGEKEELLILSQIQQGNESYNLSSLITELSKLVNDFNITLKQIQGDEGLTERINEIFIKSEQVVTKLNKSLDDNIEDLDNFLDSVSELTMKMNSLLDLNSESITSSIATTEKIITKMDSTTQKIDLVAADLHQITQKMLIDENNTINRLISDRELYDNLVTVTVRLDSLLIDIKENPKKYFKIKIF